MSLSMSTCIVQSNSMWITTCLLWLAQRMERGRGMRMRGRDVVQGVRGGNCIHMVSFDLFSHTFMNIHKH